MNPTIISTRIKYFRKLRNISQLELEIIIGASSGSICRIESGKVNPTKETLFAIARALNLNNTETAYLFGIIMEIEKEIKSPLD